MDEFVKLVNERRSASNFLENNPITKQELDEIFQLVKMAPSASNLQHANYLVVIEPELKAKVKQAAMGQHKVGTASAVIVVLGDKLAYKDAGRVYEGLLNLGIYNQQEYDHAVRLVTTTYESNGGDYQRDEAIRNASLSAMLFLLAAKSKGWDTCPMIGFNPTLLREVLSIKEQYEPVLMITIGKEKISSRKPRGYRKPISEFVTYL